MSVKYKSLLSPLKIGSFTLKNRMVSSNSLPHFLQGPETYPADPVFTHYVNRAKSGAAIVTCMGINNMLRGKRSPQRWMRRISRTLSSITLWRKTISFS